MRGSFLDVLRRAGPTERLIGADMRPTSLRCGAAWADAAERGPGVGTAVAVPMEIMAVAGPCGPADEAKASQRSTLRRMCRVAAILAEAVVASAPFWRE
jgi:hypothetical protein